MEAAISQPPKVETDGRPSQYENKAISAYCTQRGIFPATDLTQKAIIIAAATDTWVRSVGTVRELSAINTVTALAQQSIIDLAIQELGSADAAFELAIANGLSLTDMPEPGKTVQTMRASSLQNKRIAAYFLQRGLKPATGLTETTEDNGIFDFTFDFTFN